MRGTFPGILTLSAFSAVLCGQFSLCSRPTVVSWLEAHCRLMTLKRDKSICDSKTRTCSTRAGRRSDLWPSSHLPLGHGQREHKKPMLAAPEEYITFWHDDQGSEALSRQCRVTVFVTGNSILAISGRIANRGGGQRSLQKAWLTQHAVAVAAHFQNA